MRPPADLLLRRGRNRVFEGGAVRRRWSGARGVRRGAAGAIGLLLVCLIPAPAWADAISPATPAQPNVTAGDAQILVEFTAPHDGGSAITGYAADCTSSDGGDLGSNTDPAPALPGSGL